MELILTLIGSEKMTLVVDLEVEDLIDFLFNLLGLGLLHLYITIMGRQQSKWYLTDSQIFILKAEETESESCCEEQKDAVSAE